MSHAMGGTEKGQRGEPTQLVQGCHLLPMHEAMLMCRWLARPQSTRPRHAAPPTTGTACSCQGYRATVHVCTGVENIVRTASMPWPLQHGKAAKHGADQHTGPSPTVLT